MIILAYFIAVIIAMIAAFPPSVTNLAIVKYTSDENLKKAMHLAYGVALGETIIAGLALTFGVIAQKLFEQYLWIQVLFILVMIGAGIYFFNKKESKQQTINPLSPSKRFVNGLLLGGFNIPMFIYWTALFSLISRFLELNKNSPWVLTILFLSGIFSGKLLTLFFYARLSNRAVQKFGNFNSRLNRIIGIVLLIAAIGQSIKLFLQ